MFSNKSMNTPPSPLKYNVEKSVPFIFQHCTWDGGRGRGGKHAVFKHLENGVFYVVFLKKCQERGF